MKKKVILSILLVGLLAFGAGMGTLAYFTETFTSNQNKITAATFDVRSNGTLNNNAEFEFDNVYPGETGSYDFVIDKSRTEVPVQYEITLNPTGKLFGFTRENGTYASSALNLGIHRSTVGADNNLNEREYEVLTATEDGKFVVDAEFDLEGFRLVWNWPHGDNDNEFKGAEGSVEIQVVAKQKEVEPTIQANVAATLNENGETSGVYGDNRIVVEDNRFTIFGNEYYGDIEFSVEGNIATVITSTLKPQFDDKRFQLNLTKLEQGWMHMKGHWEDRDGISGDFAQYYIEISAPAGTFENLLD